jgi:hypothetical protein
MVLIAETVEADEEAAAVVVNHARLVRRRTAAISGTGRYLFAAELAAALPGKTATLLESPAAAEAALSLDLGAAEVIAAASLLLAGLALQLHRPAPAALLLFPGLRCIPVGHAEHGGQETAGRQPEPASCPCVESRTIHDCLPVETKVQCLGGSECVHLRARNEDE